MSTKRGLKLETSALYEICVQGSIERRWSDRLGDAEIRMEHALDGAPVTVVTGRFIDQAALAGALGLLYDLGYPLLSVQYLAETVER